MSTANVGLKLMTQRPQVVCCTNSARSQVLAEGHSIKIVTVKAFLQG